MSFETSKRVPNVACCILSYSEEWCREREKHFYEFIICHKAWEEHKMDWLILATAMDNLETVKCILVV
jgi:hypothetical protein